mmetsp:Transcript_28377/g.31393  ORF Transcript_28377/g.31393 Transcript_28377/m.31393 type:complete len:193 (+) Transcript_28377:125-703(+)|eukprot:CAMPEP_0194130668 /NCGR_PEP_ID=MMETSP0152-20130528/1664_1 /TAXON_ID=1049557 /ORGANISM="Thalassiothrix antarctica, Strain L6-D1" /LENGTH=192 /DNA_ID=CAMNT_0038825259 /DNA_START=119 /DNA_END=697 /DNA_ORIENTATION=-
MMRANEQTALNTSNNITATIKSKKKEEQQQHIIEHVPFYLIYFFMVYVFLLTVQLGMVVLTVNIKWIHHKKEPSWIFPIDVILVSMLVIEVSAYMFVTVKLRCDDACYFFSRVQLLDLMIAAFSLFVIILDYTTPSFIQTHVDDGKDDIGGIDLLRDILRVMRISQFLYVLKEVLRDPDWYTNDSLSMGHVF